jgi:hypothetical protein
MAPDNITKIGTEGANEWTLILRYLALGIFIVQMKTINYAKKIGIISISVFINAQRVL